MGTSKVDGLPGGESQREQSHAVKAGSVGRCVRRAALRDLRDMAKARLLEPQFPVMNCTIPRYRIYTARPSVLFKAVFVEQGSLDRWTAANEPLKGMKRVPIAIFRPSSLSAAKDQRETMRPRAVLRSSALRLSYT